MENSVPAAESDSGQVKQKIHDPEGIEPETIFFHEAQVRELILEYQREPKPETWQAIVNGTLPLIESLIRQHNFCAYEDPDALKNECILKLFKTIRHYDPARGRAFSCLSVAFTRFLITYIQTLRTQTKRNGQAYSTQEMLRLLCRSTLLPEIHGIVGEQCFARLMDVFAGATVTFPSKAALAKLRKSRNFLNGVGDAEQVLSAGPLSANTEHQLLSAVLEEHRERSSNSI